MPIPREGRSNPFRLPRGEPLRRALAGVFEQQRKAILTYLTTGRKDEAGNLPFHWPDCHDFGLGALDLSRRFTPLLQLTWEAAAARFAPRVGLDPNSWTVVNPHTERMIDEAALAFSDSMNATTGQALDRALARTREELTEGIVARGEALPALTKRLNAIFDGAARYRARAIAWTETSRAVHAAQEAAAVASGVVAGWRWLLSPDACPICVAIAARAPAVRLGHAFAVIGDNPHYSLVKHPPAHVHCNCALEEVLDVDEQPAWHDTLHQPEPATDEEIDRAAAQIADRDDAIAGRKPAKPARPGPPRRPPPPPPRRRRPNPEDPDRLPDLGASKAQIVGLEARAERLALSHATKVVFGKHRTPRELVNLTGALDDCRVAFAIDEGGRAINYTVTGPKVDTWYGYFENHGGKLRNHVGRLDASRESRERRERVGTRAHGRMAYWGSRLGLDELELRAARSDRDVGYLVWPIFGYDGPIPLPIRVGMPAELAHYSTLQDLLDLPEGRDWWHSHGDSIDLSFDLTPGSRHRDHWVDYWKRIPESERKPMEGESKQIKDKRPVPVGELDPDGHYPNGAGLSDSQVVEGWRILGEIHRDRKAPATKQDA